MRNAGSFVASATAFDAVSTRVTATRAFSDATVRLMSAIDSERPARMCRCTPKLLTVGSLIASNACGAGR